VDWLRIDADFLASNAGTAESRARRLGLYFDGGLPDWDLLEDIPRRTLSQQITADLLAASVGQLHVVLGASGEGKSTLIRQVAVDVAQASASWDVFWRHSDGSRELDRPGGWPAQRRYLFVSDDADEIAGALFDAVRRLGTQTNAHYVLAARGVDWQEQGSGLPWRSLGLEVREHPLREVDKSEAREIVEVWARHNALKQLASYNTMEDRAQALYQAARHESATDGGALLGGMLRVRFGEQLDGHVENMLKRLVRRRQSTGSPLAQAFLLIAALHDRKVRAMTPSLLAEALNIPASTIRANVINPLAEEAAVTREGDYVLVRHRAVAESAMRVAGKLSTFSVPELYASLVHAAYALYRRRLPVEIRDFRYLSKTLADDHDSAILAATACVEEEPNDLQALVNLLIALSVNRRLEELVSRAEAVVPRLRQMDRAKEAKRRFYYEWAVAEGRLGRPAIDVWLTAVALADDPQAVKLTERDAEVRTAGFGSPLQALAQSTGDPVYARGLCAVVVLLDNYPMVAQTRRHVAQFRVAVDKLGVKAKSFTDSQGDLIEAVRAASLKPERALKAVPPGGTLTFRALFEILAKYQP
jgi:hypothetical protein